MVGSCHVTPFAGMKGSKSILSILAGAHSIGAGMLGFLTMEESNALRSVCTEFREAVMDFPWMDAKSVIKGSLRAWRAAFPVARAVNISQRNDIVNADFEHIRGPRGIHTLDMSYCRLSTTITDAAFVHLRGIHTLNMSYCNRANITDAAFAHLCGIHTLDMNYCNQPAISDAAFKHLRGIHTLSLSYCTQRSITDYAFVHLRGIHMLNMSFCIQETITDEAFKHLSGIHTLYMRGCSQETITNKAFVHLQGIRALETDECSTAAQNAAAKVLSSSSSGIRRLFCCFLHR